MLGRDSQLERTTGRPNPRVQPCVNNRYFLQLACSLTTDGFVRSRGRLRSTIRAPRLALQAALACSAASEGACAPSFFRLSSRFLKWAESWERRNSVYFRLPICAVPGVT